MSKHGTDNCSKQSHTGTIKISLNSCRVEKPLKWCIQTRLIYIFKPGELHYAAEQSNEMTKYFLCIVQQICTALIKIIQQKIPGLLLLLVRYLAPVPSEKVH